MTSILAFLIVANCIMSPTFHFHIKADQLHSLKKIFILFWNVIFHE